ncbi:MAG: HAD family hydrolase [Candidatus Sungiibacteriota bacterium]
MALSERCRGWGWLGVENIPLHSIRAIVCDIDNTLYRNLEYHAAGTRGEINAVAEIIGVATGESISYDEMAMRIGDRRQALSVMLGRPAGMTETVISLGITRAQWDKLRCQVWRPEEWLEPDPDVCGTLILLSQKHRIVFGTNSPVAVGRRVLVALGIDKAVPDTPLFGSDTLGVSKPHSDFFMRIAERLGFMPQYCIAIGDRIEMDGMPALAAGYASALIVPGGRDAFIAAAYENLINQNGEDIP